MSEIPKKQCSKCKEWFPLAMFSKDKSKPDGLRPDCYNCRKAHREETKHEITQRRQRYYKENKQQILKSDKEYKARNKDKEAKRKSAYNLAHRTEKKEYNNKYRAENLDKIKQQKFESYRANREVISTRNKAYRNRPEVKARYQAYYRQWQINNPERVAQYGHKRRAAKNGSGGNYTAQEWLELKEMYGFTCLCCGHSEPEILLTVDHIIPLSKGGTNDIDNIQPLCLSCNTSKKDKAIDYRK